MSYLNFDKTQLINLGYSLGIEFLRSNRAGSFGSSTIINCHTRKYHGMLICPLPELDGDRHLLVSSVDETVIQHEREFHLAVRKYPGVYHPGHKYIQDFSAEPIPTLTYRVGGVILKKEFLLAQEEESTLIRYTLVDAHSPTRMRLHPFLGFRNIHTLSHANMDVNTKYEEVEKGIKMRMYDAYPFLYMQMNTDAEYVHAPDWFYNIEYSKEKKRGYDHSEDLYVPGFFEFSIKKGESIVFSASLKEEKPAQLKRKFTTELKKRIPRDSYEHCLENSAQQFLVRKKDGTHLIAGFPWFGNWSRDTFVALPGLTLALGDAKTCKSVLDSSSKKLKGSLFPNIFDKEDSPASFADAPLWYIWAIQKYKEHTKSSPGKILNSYGKYIFRILNGYRQGTDYNIKMHDNGLLFAGQDGMALTWMDAFIEGKPVTPRTGFAVEINALWYNAIRFALELAQSQENSDFTRNWNDIPAQIEHAFAETFWNEKKGYLCDYVCQGKQDWAVRPNQLFAASLPFSPIEEDMRKRVVDKVKKELLTPRGVRTLSPKNPEYKAISSGDERSRYSTYHQGSAYPWLLNHYAEAYLKLHGPGGLNHIKKIYWSFEDEMNKHGIGSISGRYDGNPPHQGRGSISKAWSVAALLCVRKLIEQYENKPL